MEHPKLYFFVRIEFSIVKLLKTSKKSIKILKVIFDFFGSISRILSIKTLKFFQKSNSPSSNSPKTPKNRKYFFCHFSLFWTLTTYFWRMERLKLKISIGIEFSMVKLPKKWHRESFFLTIM